MKGRRLYDDGGRIANTILEQLGGAGRLRMMTGAYNFVDLGNGLSFKIKNQRANYIKIKLTSMDLYDVEVGRIRGNTYKVVNSAEGLYFDQLKPFIEKSTGMYLNLFGTGGMIQHKTEDGETLKYKIDTDEMSVEVDYPTMEYLSENGIVMKREARKLRDTYIFWYDQIPNAIKEELEEVLEVELPVHYGKDDDDDYERDDYAHGGELTDSAYKKRMKMFGHTPYGKTKGKFRVTYNADGEPQTEIWESMEMAKDSAKRYSRMDDFADVKIFDESGKEIQFMEKGGKVYKLGDKWSDDFDYNGMLRMGLKANSSWSSKKLQKLFDSFEDVNYHKSSENLWRAIQVLKDAESGKFSKTDIKIFGSEKQAKENNIKMADEYIDAFHDDVLEEMMSYRRGGTLKYYDGGMTAGRWYRDNTGEEFKYIGKIDEGADKGKLIFSDGSKRVFKTLDDFGGKPRENKIFGFFAKGGTLDYSKISSVEVSDIDRNDAPDYVDAYISYAEYDGEPMTEEQLEELNYDGDFVYSAVERYLYAKGGKVKKKRVRFVDKVESIADRLDGTKVPKRLKKDYGGRYNREEAEEAGRRIAGAQLRDRNMMADGGMMAKGGKTKKKGDVGKSGTQYGYTLKEYEEMGEKIGLFVSPKDWWKSREGKKYEDSFGRTQTIGRHSQDERQEMQSYGYRIAIGMDLGSEKIPASARKYVIDNNLDK
jgi:hypothetical protein